MKKVSMDFDGTLDRADVQDYVAGLIGLEVDVHILTDREPEDENEIDFIDNSDLWDVVNQLAIPVKNVRFTSYLPKADWLVDSGTILHLDDQEIELKKIDDLTLVIPVDVKKPGWEERCDEILKL